VTSTNNVKCGLKLSDCISYSSAWQLLILVAFLLSLFQPDKKIDQHVPFMATWWMHEGFLVPGK
jgi:hypothetical protein